MSEEETRKEEIHKLPEAVVSTRRRQISIVWVVPLVALLIGAWLVYKTLSEKGPIITISFKSWLLIVLRFSKCLGKNLNHRQNLSIIS